jgi:hypothetical protein
LVKSRFDSAQPVRGDARAPHRNAAFALGSVEAAQSIAEGTRETVPIADRGVDEVRAIHEPSRERGPALQELAHPMR